jgi:hypothetical protein
MESFDFENYNSCFRIDFAGAFEDKNKKSFSKIVLLYKRLCKSISIGTRRSENTQK